MSDINLLQLPEIVLEEIFSYCEGASLIKLTECCKFTKHFVETTPCLMDRISLRVPVIHHTNLSAEEKNILEACLESKRKYKSLLVGPRDGIVEYGGRDTPLREPEELVERHASNIKKIDFWVDSVSINLLMHYLNKMVNLEDISVYYRRVGSDYTTEAPKFTNSFQHLKHLMLAIDSLNISFCPFKKCKTLETLELSLSYPDWVSYRLDALLENSRDTLHSMKIICNYNEIDIDQLEYYLTSLIERKLDLKVFRLYLPCSKLRSLYSIINFLKSQKNLEKFVFRATTDSGLVNRFGEVLAELKSLKTVEFNFEERDQINQVVQQVPKIWNLDDLEKVKIRCYSGTGFEVSEKIFSSPSNNLKRINFEGSISFEKNMLDIISKSFINLVELKVDERCTNHSSNDIFTILEYLKKLKILKFSFPKQDVLNEELIGNEKHVKINYHLPVIEDVHFSFNDCISITQALILVQFMKNMSSYCFHGWRNYSPNYLEMITRELPNLMNLKIDGYLMEYEGIERSLLNQIKGNVQKFNYRPNVFRINGREIDYLRIRQR